MKEQRREIINDSMQALHALAKLMPQLNAQCSPVEMLETINSALGANLSWVSVESADGPRVVCAGDVTCHAFNVADFLASTLLQRHHRAWALSTGKRILAGRYFPLSTRAMRGCKAASCVNSQRMADSAVVISFWLLMENLPRCRY